MGILAEEFGEGERPCAKQLFQVLFGLERGPGVFRVDEDALKRELFEVMEL